MSGKIDPALATQIAGAAADLTVRPRDLDAWWRVAQALERADRHDEAASVLTDLGRAASELGAAGLAMACSKVLSSWDRERDAAALLERIARTHCSGSKRIDNKLRAVPPSPPVVDKGSSSTAAVLDLETAVEQAMAASATAAKSAAERAPDKLPPTPLIGVISGDELAALSEVVSLLDFSRGDIVIDVGQPATSLYWVARGGLEVSRDQHLLGELHANAFFGEIALLGGSQRTARVACLEPTTLIEIPADAVESLAAKTPRLAQVLANYARQRLLANVMRTSELFSRLTRDERRALLPQFKTSFFEQGEKLISKGTTNEQLFVIVSGTVEVRDEGEVLATLTVGDGIGEISMLGRRPATADVVAVSATAALTVGRDVFDAAAVNHPGLLAEVYKLLVERERVGAIVHDADDLIV